MTTRRDPRQTHVRPRPPSTGRPAPVKIRPRSPSPTRLSVHRPIQRDRGLPLIGKLGLIAAIALLGVGVLYLGAGGLGRIVGGIGSALGGFVTSVTATPTPLPSVAVVADAPTLQEPTEPYTQESTVDLVVTVPPGVVGDPRSADPRLPGPQGPIAGADPGGAAGGDTADDHPGRADQGRSTTSRSRSSGRAASRSRRRSCATSSTRHRPRSRSPRPRRARSSTARPSRSWARRRPARRSSPTTRPMARRSRGTAATDGTFSLSLALGTGINEITINGTDPAGNANELVADRAPRQRQADGDAERDRLSNLGRQAAAGPDPPGDGLRSGRQRPGRCGRHLHPEHPGHPDGDRRPADGRGRQGDRSRRPFRPAPTPARAGATVLVSSDQFGSTQDYTVITIEP